MKIRFFSQTRLILSFVPVGTGGKIAEVGGKKIFSYANLLFQNKSNKHNQQSGLINQSCLWLILWSQASNRFTSLPHFTFS